MLVDTIMEDLNKLFEDNKLAIKIHELVLYRPVYQEPPFENIEVISDAKRVLHCDPLYIVFRVEKDGLNREYEQRYKNSNGKFELTLCQLQYCETVEGQKVDEIEKEEAEFAKLLGLSIIWSIMKIIKTEK